VIEELNNGFGDGAGVKFEPLGWEDTLASTGWRSQAVINREIDRCDASRLGLRPDPHVILERTSLCDIGHLFRPGNAVGTESCCLYTLFSTPQEVWHEFCASG